MLFTPNPQGCTVIKFAQDIIPVLPVALPQLRKLGLMTTCAHCGKPHDGATFIVRCRTVPGEFTEVHILALCNTCAINPDDLPKNDWAHVCESSGLFPLEHEWATLIRALYCYAIMTLREAHGGLILTTTDTP